MQVTFCCGIDLFVYSSSMFFFVVVALRMTLRNALPARGGRGANHSWCRGVVSHSCGWLGGGTDGCGGW